MGLLNTVLGYNTKEKISLDDLDKKRELAKELLNLADDVVTKNSNGVGQHEVVFALRVAGELYGSDTIDKPIQEIAQKYNGKLGYLSRGDHINSVTVFKPRDETDYCPRGVKVDRVIGI